MTAKDKNPYIWYGQPKIFKKDNKAGGATVVDIFCGAGGASKGFEDAGFNIILGVDHLKPALKTFQLNHKNASTILGDVKKITEEMVNEVIGDKRVDVLIGGVPCQGFSLNNRNRHVDDPRNQLFWEYICFVRILKPNMLVLENVSGMKSMESGEIVQTIENEITSLGCEIGKNYKISHRILNSADYGVPQLRKRLIFIGASQDYEVRFPKAKLSKDEYLTVADAINDLPSLESNQEKHHYASTPNNTFQELMRKNSSRLENNKAPNHPKSTIERIRNTENGKAMYTNYKQRIRLSWTSPSPTQVCGGIRPQFQFGHPRDNRGLTIRERARLQSFPDDYVFTGGIVQQRVQTGNAIPPLLAQSIAEEMYPQLCD